MNCSQNNFLLFTFLKCNVVYLCSWTARTKVFYSRGPREAERQRQAGAGGEAEKKKFKACEVKLQGHSLCACVNT